MIHYYNYEAALKKFPKMVQDNICYGHLGRDLFSEEQILELKTGTLKELAIQKVPCFQIPLLANMSIKDALLVYGVKSVKSAR